MKNLTPQATRMRKQLVKDNLGYLEAVGKQDNQALEEVLDTKDGKGTVLRLFFGASVKLPTRAATYLVSAARTAQLLPVEQLQIICVTSLGEAINGTPKQRSAAQFATLAGFGMHILQHTMPDVAERTIFCEDDEVSPLIQTIRPHVKTVLGANLGLQSRLKSMGAKHGGDFLTYTAAHVLNQDTPHMQLQSLGGDAAIKSERIVTVGCQQEKTFYSARMGVRELMDPVDLIPSVQVFTKHVSAPYFVGIGGEQMLDDAIATRQIDFSAGNAANERDLRHFEPFLTSKDHLS